MNDIKELHFSVEGEFITQLARDRFYNDHNFAHAMELLRSCTMSDLTATEQTMLCLQILNGEAEIRGNSDMDEYGVYFENDDRNDSDLEKIINVFDEMSKTLQKREKELLDIKEKFAFLSEHLYESEKERMNNLYYPETLEFIFPESHGQPDTVKAFLDHMAREDSGLPEYGWLEPNGTWHEVPFGEHSKFAKEYCEKKYPFRDYAHMYWYNEADGKRSTYVNGDFLVHVLGWVLIDSPMQGKGILTYDKARGFTKAQREFLYGYFKDHGRYEEANALYQEDQALL